jgi:hypothetical protein
MSSRILNELINMLAGRSEVAAPKKDGRPGRQRNAYRERISARGLIDGSSQHAACTVGEATQPQGACEANGSEDAMIKPEELRSYRPGLGCASHPSLSMELGRSLVSHKVVATAEHEIRNE